ncbi:MAG: hypothetical protein NT013_08200 [Planctomycetia bacterium]|nr:hypothetical protein [Planctomycetia bacterium]
MLEQTDRKSTTTEAGHSQNHLELDSLHHLLSPDCRLGLDDLQQLGIGIDYVLDRNVGVLWRFIGLPSGNYFDQPRCYFPTWLNELLSVTEKNAIADTHPGRVGIVSWFLDGEARRGEAVNFS